MMIKVLLLLMGCLAQAAGLAAPQPVRPQELRLLTHELPPLNFREPAGLSGLCTELVRELQRRSGIGGEVALVPFARGLAMLGSGADVGLFFTTRTAEREALFQWVGPLVNVTSSVYVRNGSGLKMSGSADFAAAKRIITHRGSFLEQAVRDLGYADKLSLANTPEDALRLLLLGDDKDSVLLLTDAPVPATLLKLGHPVDAIKPIYLARKAQGYLAISKATAPAVALRLQKELDAMKADGSFAAIYAKWLPKAVMPGLSPDPSVDGLKAGK